ncbi:MAG TPA: alpha/beta hydrolase [Patescibacteria group bacterium]|nr:alpha/beta hydrolase [Patescibacteria group bacterium]
MNDAFELCRLKDGRYLAYNEYGDLKGKPVFFFHGWPSSRLFAAKNDALAKKLHIRIISPDRPGFGYSDYQKDRTLLDWPGDVTALTDHLKIKTFAVMGQSGGGPYAAVCAYKIPERITKAGIVVGLAPIIGPESLDGMMWMSKIGWANYRKYPVVRRISTLIQYINAYYGIHLGLHKYFFGAKEDRKLYRNPKLSESVLANYREAFRQGIRGPELDLKLYCTDWGFDVGAIHAKAFLFYGEDDRNVSLNMGKYYHSHIAGSVLTVYPGEGHFISVSHAEEILTTLTS